jgi:hypothetical protein
MELTSDLQEYQLKLTYIYVMESGIFIILYLYPIQSLSRQTYKFSYIFTCCSPKTNYLQNKSDVFL